jgi:hypothetical protein
MKPTGMNNLVLTEEDIVSERGVILKNAISAPKILPMLCICDRCGHLNS